MWTSERQMLRHRYLNTIQKLLKMIAPETRFAKWLLVYHGWLAGMGLGIEFGFAGGGMERMKNGRGGGRRCGRE